MRDCSGLRPLQIDTGAEDAPETEEDSQAAKLLAEVNAELEEARKEVSTACGL